MGGCKKSERKTRLCTCIRRERQCTKLCTCVNCHNDVPRNAISANDGARDRITEIENKSSDKSDNEGDDSKTDEADEADNEFEDDECDEETVNEENVICTYIYM